ncbi:MAG TPA: hypothetical protein VLB73_03745 [Patescibacteria group bacterium]|nr:hypothetical protein [Patescibacteria group bacterium]
MTEEEQPKRKRGAKAHKQERRDARKKAGSAPNGPSSNPKLQLHFDHHEQQERHRGGTSPVRRKPPHKRKRF